MEIIINNQDQILLGMLQSEFPMTREPYAEMGRRLNVSDNETRQIIGRLKTSDLVRTIGPVLNPALLGYQTTLVATAVDSTGMDNAARLLNDHSAVSHAYEREHHYNLWFTLALPEGTDINSEIEQIRRDIGAEVAFALPARKLFKLRTHFGIKGGASETGVRNAPDVKHGPVSLSGEARKIINTLQQDLPLITRPFAEMAVQAGMDEEEFLAGCRALLNNGVMRRFGAAINHRRAGYVANGMTCWEAPQDKIESAAALLASLSAVSHCYERETNPLWKQNLFAMIHGYSKAECQEIADKVSAEIGLTECTILFSTKELKKKRVKYQV
ncbi:hypothetical protein ACFLWU_04825 [Chloroflexota bacterium]